MLDVYLIIDLIVVVSLAGLGLTVFIKDRNASLNRIFAFFVASVAIWIISNYISNNTDYSPQTATIANYFVFGFSYASSVSLLAFAIALAHNRAATRLFMKLRALLVTIGIVSMTPLLVKGVSLQGEVYAVQFGPALPLYFIGLIGSLVGAFYVVQHGKRHSKGKDRARLQTLFISLCWSLPALVLANFLLPAITGWFGLTNIGILPMLILIYGLYYGVIKHRLFDLRLVVVRAAAYVVSLGFVSAIFVLVSNYLKGLIDTSGNAALSDVLNILLIATVLALYGPTKRKFTKLTDKLFYQDAYDPQSLYAELNRILVSSLDVEFIMMQSLSVIMTAIKPEWMLASIKESDEPHRSFTTRKLAVTDEDIDKIGQFMSRSRQKVLVTDYLEGKGSAELHSLLRRNNIAVLIRFSQNYRNGDEGFGFLALSDKKSGNPYNGLDTEVLDTVANELTIATQNALHYEEIQQFNTALQVRINEATHKLRTTNVKLKALDETKDDFISMASHQLRTPLTSVKGYLSMVLEGDAGDINETQRKMLSQAYTSSQRMVYLIADLLNVSRLRTGKFIIEPSETDLSKMIEEELGQLTEAASSRMLTLTYNKPANFPTLMLDETKTRQVLMNFIDNAIYYTPKDGHINIELKDTGPTVEFRVIDDGIGVPKSEQHHLFTKFYRAGNARQARPDGTGLGLFMAKKVISAQNGAIIFDSKEGKGSTFGFTFAKSKLQDITTNTAKS